MRKTCFTDREDKDFSDLSFGVFHFSYESLVVYVFLGGESEDDVDLGESIDD